MVAENLAVAGELLREAKDQGAQIACLPENFSFIGLKDADKLQVGGDRWQGSRAGVLEQHRAETEDVDPGRHASSSKAIRRNASPMHRC